MTHRFAPHTFALPCLAVATLLMLLSFASTSYAQAVEPETVTLKEQLGLDWSHELISETLSFAPGELTGQAVATVTTPENKLTPAQISDVARHPDGSVAAMTVWFFADLPANTSQAYTITPGQVNLSGEHGPAVALTRDAAAGLLTLRTTGDQPVGVTLIDRNQTFPWPTEVTDEMAPVHRLLLPQGTAGQSSLDVPFRVKAIHTKVLAEGPLFAEVAILYTFEEGSWQLRFKAIADEPILLVQEKFDTGHSGQDYQSADRFWTITFAGNDEEAAAFNPTQLFYTGEARIEGKSDLLKAGLPQSWQDTGALPRDTWVASRVNGMTLTGHPANPDMPLYALSGWPTAQSFLGSFARLVEPEGYSLGIAAQRAMDWRHPMSIRITTNDQGQPQLKMPLQMYDQGWPLDGYGAGSPNYTGVTQFVPDSTAWRSYGLMITPATDETENRLADMLALTAKFSAHPLNEVRHMLLDWPDPLASEVSTKAPESPTEDGQKALDIMRSRVALHQLAGYDSAYSMGDHAHFAKHIYPKLAKVAHDPTALPAAARAELRRLLTFEAYHNNDPESFPYGSGVHLNNPNMTIMAVEARTKAAMLVKGHPMFQTWGNDSISLVEDFIRRFTFPSGVPYENPHYILGVTLTWSLLANDMLREEDIGDALDNELFREMVRFSQNWLTPPDLRFKGHRVILPWGNGSYQSMPPELATLLINYLKDSNPDLAAEMQWVANQTLSEDKQVHIVEPKTPELTSGHHEDFGVTFRHGFGTEHETLFQMIAGKTHGHYELETDQMAYTLYAKGHPIHLHFGNGYFPILNRPWLRNRVSFDMMVESSERNETWIEDAVFLPTVEYANAMRQVDQLKPIKLEYPKLADNGRTWLPETNDDWHQAGLNPEDIPLTTWRRRVAFIKDADNPAGPNYFVLRDSFEGTPTKPTELSLWFLANNMTRKGDLFHFDGQVKVDMDVFVNHPADPEVHTDSYGHKQQPYVRHTGFDPEYHPDGKRWEEQKLLRLKQPVGEGYMVVLYPRLKENDPPATITRVSPETAKVTTVLSTDTITLAVTPQTVEAGKVTYTSKAGVLRQYKDGRTTFNNLEGPCTLKVGDKTWQGQGALTAVLLSNGDWEIVEQEVAAR